MKLDYSALRKEQIKKINISNCKPTANDDVTILNDGDTVKIKNKTDMFLIKYMTNDKVGIQKLLNP